MSEVGIAFQPMPHPPLEMTPTNNMYVDGEEVAESAGGKLIEPPPARGVAPTAWDRPVVPKMLQATYDALLHELVPHIWMPNAEFEIKLGCIDESGNFRTGVTRSEFENIHNALTDWQGWDRRTDWYDTRDTFRSDGTRITEHARAAEPPRAVRKVHVVDVDMKTETNIALRAAVRIEQPTQLTAPQQGAGPAPYDMHVRIKRRDSFTTHFARYDLTMVWSGASDSIARSNEPTYEVEVEFLLDNPGAKAYRESYAILTTLMKAVNVANSTDVKVHRVTHHQPPLY